MSQVLQLTFFCVHCFLGLDLQYYGNVSISISDDRGDNAIMYLSRIQFTLRTGAGGPIAVTLTAQGPDGETLVSPIIVSRNNFAQNQFISQVQGSRRLEFLKVATAIYYCPVNSQLIP